MFKDIDLEVYTPLDYWQAGAEYPPEGTGERFRRFEIYRDLSRGDFESILPDWPKKEWVLVNAFQTVTDFRPKFLLSKPPETAAVAVQESLMNEAVEATFDVIYDYTRYGTGLFHAFRGEDGAPHVQALDPRFWFPAQDGGESIAIEDKGWYDVWQFFPEATEFTRYERSNSTRRLGEVIEKQTFTPLQAGTVPVFNCGGRPRDGVWGASLYPVISTLVAELTVEYTRISEIHQRAAVPFYVIEGGDPESAADVESALVGRTMAEIGDFDVTDTDGTFHQRRAIAFEHQRLSGLILPVDGKLVAVPTNADTADIRENIDKVHNEIYKLSATPVNFLGNQDGICLLYTSPSPRDRQKSRMPSSA